MKDNRNTFPKLETGMVVTVKLEDGFGSGSYLVVGDKLLSDNSWNRLSDYLADGTALLSNHFDIIAVYSGCEVRSLNLEKYLEKLTPIWELKDQCPTQAKIAELEETIKKASQQIQQLKEEMNV